MNGVGEKQKVCSTQAGIYRLQSEPVFGISSYCWFYLKENDQQFPVQLRYIYIYTYIYIYSVIHIPVLLDFFVLLANKIPAFL